MRRVGVSPHLQCDTLQRRATSLSSWLMALRLAILTISDACSRGERADSSGDLIASWAREHKYAVTERGLIPDDTVRISVTLAEWADTDRTDLILTTGGTGL